MHNKRMKHVPCFDENFEFDGTEVDDEYLNNLNEEHELEIGVTNHFERGESSKKRCPINLGQIEDNSDNLSDHSSEDSDEDLEYVQLEDDKDDTIQPELEPEEIDQDEKEFLPQFKKFLDKSFNCTDVSESTSMPINFADELTLVLG